MLIEAPKRLRRGLRVLEGRLRGRRQLEGDGLSPCEQTLPVEEPDPIGVFPDVERDLERRRREEPNGDGGPSGIGRDEARQATCDVASVAGSGRTAEARSDLERSERHRDV